MALLVPPGVVTRTLTVPALPTGVVAVMVVAFTTITDAAAAYMTLVLVIGIPLEFMITVVTSQPKWTAVAPVKVVPVIVTDCPPTVGPDVGLIDVTVGAA